MTSGVFLEDFSVATAVGQTAANGGDLVAAIELNNLSDAFVRRVSSFDPAQEPSNKHLQSGGIRMMYSKRITITDVTMEKAENRGDGGNGYLFEVRQSSELLIKDSVARAGRHNFIQNWGFGLSGCVFLRITSEGSSSVGIGGIPFPSGSEFHHSLAMANLIDDAVIADGWAAAPRARVRATAPAKTCSGTSRAPAGCGPFNTARATSSAPPPRRRC